MEPKELLDLLINQIKRYLTDSVYFTAFSVDTLKKKAKNMLKKLNKAMWGQEKLKLIIEDPHGNSAIIDEKAKKSKL